MLLNSIFLSNIPDESSVKVQLLYSDYMELKEIAAENSYSLKKLVNKSIGMALDEIEESGFYTRRRSVRVVNAITKKCSLKIKNKHYDRLVEICDLHDIRVKDIVRDIILHYPTTYYKRD
ncbi:hypothetical protein DFQ01_1501 [Paenibacillus cellulosilyticus]|uniref:Uncharacterized protein n=1 Tax=Paenibacillus cellulosilyticus TaxID=375489 RepID=A0A2V2YAE4_9BACL|nr:hypothetical protein DFQ01_1501 [Paenibacillus cellulosilyticus]